MTADTAGTIPPPLPAGYVLEQVEVASSSNDLAKQLAEQGAPAGTVVWVTRQTSGRGRYNRTWVSPEGNLFCSLILRPQVSLSEAANLGFVAALAVMDAAARFLNGNAELRCKWPNDVLLQGRKLSGILLESKGSGEEGVEWLVLGIGINLRHYPAEADFPATSMKARLGEDAPDAAAMLEVLLDAFAFWYGLWEGQGFASIRQAWLEKAYDLGGRIRVRLGEREMTGRFCDLDAQGALVLEDQSGKRHRITAGDVFPGER